METDLPSPDLSPDSGEYWVAAAKSEFKVQRCDSCGAFQFPPGHLCRQCGSDQISWQSPSGRGRIHSFTIVHRAPTPALRARVPYVIVLVDLDEGPRIMTNLIGDDARGCAIDDPVEVCFEARGPDHQVPQFRLASR